MFTSVHPRDHCVCFLARLKYQCILIMLKRVVNVELRQMILCDVN